MLTEPPVAELLRLSEALAGRPLDAATPVATGGNNRLWRLDGDGGPVALKLYPPQAEDPRDRLGAEWAALSFLHAQGIDAVPAPLGRDASHHCALYEWVEGQPVETPQPDDIDTLADFLAGLQDLKDRAGAIGPASAACPAPADALDQLQARLARAARVPELATFLAEEVAPLAEAVTAGIDRDSPPLPRARQALSPSDFGFHNALRRPDGRLAFLDFEYFGWDDPVKAVADVMLHPGMELDAAQAARFRDRVTPVFSAADPGFGARLAALYPVYALIWVLIVLNEFLPERWHRRNLGGRGAEAEQARARQMTRARARLEEVRKAHGRP